MEFQPKLDASAEMPLYRQLAEQLTAQIRSGLLAPGDRLPATRELAGLLGLNRTTISAAYELLEADGLISGHVGRGSFVAGTSRPPAEGLDWHALLNDNRLPSMQASMAGEEGISFAFSRPSE